MVFLYTFCFRMEPIFKFCVEDENGFEGMGIVEPKAKRRFASVTEVPRGEARNDDWVRVVETYARKKGYT